MKVTYLNHSGFLLEWEHSYWLFDYYKGEIPKLNPAKDIFVFCSHSHEDHLNPIIFTLYQEYPSVRYLFSNQIRRTYRKWQKNPDLIPYPLPPIEFLYERTDTNILDSTLQPLKIHTLRSTDCGCAFLIEYEGKTIYHAGDLHWWYWSEEAEDWNKKMTADYKREMKYLENKEIDLAFTPLDPRQEKDYALGMNYFLENTRTKHVFPMHFWNDFSIIETYLQEYPVAEETHFHPLKYDGQCTEIML